MCSVLGSPLKSVIFVVICVGPFKLTNSESLFYATVRHVRTFVAEVSDGFEEDQMKCLCSRRKCKSLIVKSQRLLLVIMSKNYFCTN